MSDDPAAMLRVAGQRPIMALLELLGRRWTLRVLWELRGGPLTSRALRAAAGGLAPSVLQARVNELRGAQLLELGDDGYGLTPLGRELLEVFTPIYLFADRWAAEMQPVADKDGSRFS